MSEERTTRVGAGIGGIVDTPPSMCEFLGLSKEGGSIRISYKKVMIANALHAIVARRGLSNDLIGTDCIFPNGVNGGAMAPEVGRLGVIVADAAAQKGRTAHELLGLVCPPRSLTIEVVAVSLYLLVPFSANTRIGMAMPQDVLRVRDGTLAFLTWAYIGVDQASPEETVEGPNAASQKGTQRSPGKRVFLVTDSLLASLRQSEVGHRSLNVGKTRHTNEVLTSGNKVRIFAFHRWSEGIDSAINPDGQVVHDGNPGSSVNKEFYRMRIIV